MLPEVVNMFLINDYYDYNKEKKLLATSDNYGRDVIGVPNLCTNTSVLRAS